MRVRVDGLVVARLAARNQPLVRIARVNEYLIEYILIVS